MDSTATQSFSLKNDTCNRLLYFYIFDDITILSKQTNHQSNRFILSCFFIKDCRIWVKGLYLLKKLAIMARMGNSLLKDLQGSIGKQLVVKQYADKTVVAKYPYIKKKQKPTELQQVFRNHFT